VGKRRRPARKDRSWGSDGARRLSRNVRGGQCEKGVGKSGRQGLLPRAGSPSQAYAPAQFRPRLSGRGEGGKGTWGKVGDEGFFVGVKCFRHAGV